MGTWRHFPRETTEHIGIPLVDEGTDPPTALAADEFTAQIVTADERPDPGGWVSPTPDDDDVPTLQVTAHEPGGYDLYVKVGAVVRLFDRFYLD